MPASLTREMPCHLCLPACFLAGQGCDTALSPRRQERLHGRKPLTAVSWGALGAKEP